MIVAVKTKSFSNKSQRVFGPILTSLFIVFFFFFHRTFFLIFVFLFFFQMYSCTSASVLLSDILLLA